MNIFELIVVITTITILTINQIKTQPLQQPMQITDLSLTNLLFSLQTYAITYQKNIHICGVSVNSTNLLLHNCNKNQQDWSYGILAYIDYNNSSHYNEKYINEKIYLLILKPNLVHINNSCASELIINNNGIINKECQLRIENQDHSFNKTLKINTQGLAKYQ